MFLLRVQTLREIEMNELESGTDLRYVCTPVGWPPAALGGPKRVARGDPRHRECGQQQQHPDSDKVQLRVLRYKVYY